MMLRRRRSARMRRDRRAGIHDHSNTTRDAIPPILDAGASSPSRRVTGRLVALSASAVLTVYAAGYIRTRAAAERITDAAEERGSPVSAPPTIGLAIQGVQTIAPRSDVASRDAPPIEALPRESPVQPVDSPSARGRGRARDGESRKDGQRRRAGTNDDPSDTTASPIQGLTLAAGESSGLSARSLQTEAMSPAAAPGPLAASGYKDGTYLGWGTSRHGDIQASVAIAGGRIVSASIAQCLTRYPCSWIAALPGQVVTYQSAKVDYVSGATQSTQAFSSAVTDALSKAR